MKSIGYAAAAACLLASGAPALAKPRETVSLAVSTSAVNLSDPAAVAALRKAVAVQIAEACNPGDRIGADMAPDWRCREEMAASFEPRLMAMVPRASGGAASAQD